MSDTQTVTLDAATILQNAISNTKHRGPDGAFMYSLEQHAQNYEDALAAVQKLENETTSNGLAVESMQRNITTLRKQISYINDALLEEATARDWCEEYGEWVDQVNSYLGEDVLTRPSREFSIDIQLSVTVKTHNGTSEDDIAEQLNEAACDHLRYMECSDFEVVEV